MEFMLLAVLTIFFLEKDKRNRKLLFYPALALLLLAFLRAENIAPEGVFVSTAIVLVIVQLPKGARFTAAGAGICLLLMFLMSGNVSSYLDTVVKADSLYGIPQEEIETMEVLLEAHDVEGIVAPKQLSPYLPIYSAELKTVYTYPEDGDAENLSFDAKILYEEMQKHDFDTELLTVLARNSGCNYIILDNGYHYPSTPLLAFDFEKLATVGEYDIYKDVR